MIVIVPAMLDDSANIFFSFEFNCKTWVIFRLVLVHTSVTYPMLSMSLSDTIWIDVLSDMYHKLSESMGISIMQNYYFHKQIDQFVPDLHNKLTQSSIISIAKTWKAKNTISVWHLAKLLPQHPEKLLPNSVWQLQKENLYPCVSQAIRYENRKFVCLVRGDKIIKCLLS